MTFKWIGAALIIAACGGVGFAIAAAYLREERELRKLTTALDYMACELQYRLTPLPELCRLAGRECAGIVGKILTELASELESGLKPQVEDCVIEVLCQMSDLPKRIREAFLLLGSSLGRFDMEGQMKGLEIARGYCRRELENMANGRENRLRSYQTLGICAGAALAILFV